MPDKIAKKCKNTKNDSTEENKHTFLPELNNEENSIKNVAGNEHKRISKELFNDISKYIDKCYTDTSPDLCTKTVIVKQKARSEKKRPVLSKKAEKNTACKEMPCAELSEVDTDICALTQSFSLEQAIEHIDESFSQMLIRKIDEKGMTDAQCYKKANIDRKLFSKIRGDINYRPSKATAIAFAIALELQLEEAKEMLMKAGFALSHSNKFDIIIEYFITKQIYDIFEINEALYAFDQNLLGA